MGAGVPPKDSKDSMLAALAARRWRLSLVLTGAMLVTYFGFLLLVAYRKAFLGTLIVPGLSVGILLGASVILVAWGVTGIYIRWANRRYDPELARVKQAIIDARSADAPPPEIEEPREPGSQT